MEYRDYYATLGVDKGATQADIKKAYRRLARKHHPDVNKGDAAAEQRFKEISEANEVLSDPQKRKAYDQLGADWASYQRAGGAGGNPFAGFCRRCAAGRAACASSSTATPPTSPASATSSAPSSGRATRPAEGGRRQQARALASSRSSAASAATAGRATRPPASARAARAARAGPPTAHRPMPRPRRRSAWRRSCTGTERHIEVGGKRLEVSIPPGVTDGQRIRLSGKAEGGGHIYITVHVAPHPLFARDGDDLSMELPLTLGEALLGGQVTIEALGGQRLLLTIPPATQNGRLFRLAGQGLPRFGGGGRGDLRVRTSVVLPASLDDEGRRRARALVDHIAQPDPRQAAASRR